MMKKIFCLFTITLILAGCSPKVKSYMGVVYGKGQRTVKQYEQDIIIKRQLDKKLKDEYPYSDRFVYVEESVYNRNILLAGYVAQKRMKTELVDIAKSIPGINRVIDEVKVAQDTTFKSAYLTSDSTTAGLIRGRLVADKFFRIEYIDVIVIHGVAYLNGKVKKAKHLDRLHNIVRQTKGVKKVVSFVIDKEKL